MTSGFIKWWKVNKDFIKADVAKVFKSVALALGDITLALKGAFTAGLALFGALGTTGTWIVGALAGIGAVAAGLISGPVGALLMLSALLLLGAKDWENYKNGAGSQIGDLAIALDDAFGGDQHPFVMFLNSWRYFWETAPKDSQAFSKLFVEAFRVIAEAAETYFAVPIALIKGLISTYKWAKDIVSPEDKNPEATAGRQAARKEKQDAAIWLDSMKKDRFRNTPGGKRRIAEAQARYDKASQDVLPPERRKGYVAPGYSKDTSPSYRGPIPAHIPKWAPGGGTAQDAPWNVSKVMGVTPEQLHGPTITQDNRFSLVVNMPAGSDPEATKKAVLKAATEVQDAAYRKAHRILKPAAAQ
jgi:hypothetical protein